MSLLVYFCFVIVGFLGSDVNVIIIFFIFINSDLVVHHCYQTAAPVVVVVTAAVGRIRPSRHFRMKMSEESKGNVIS